jgi:hypothetical protein
MIQTRRVRPRELTFTTLGEALAEAERLAACERAGTLQRLGNWSTGQIFGHLAWWIDESFDGTGFHPPWWLRLIGPLLKRRMTDHRAKPGFRLPGTANGTLGTEDMPLDEGLARLRRAVTRLQASAPTVRDPALGWLTHDEWTRLHLRHFELHLGFLVPPLQDQPERSHARGA